MANVTTTIKRVEFIFEEGITHCNIFYTSDEQGNLFWGGGWKTKSFPAKMNAVQIIQEEAKDYILWVNGRRQENGVEEVIPNVKGELISVLVGRLETAINLTPTGQVRDLLCDLNIALRKPKE